MARPLFRVLISGEPGAFQPLAVAAGQPMLDRYNSASKTLAKWLGRLVADPIWQAGAIEFYVRDGQGNQLAGLACEPVTAADLRGPLKREFAELQNGLKNAQPASPAEQALYAFVCKGLLDPKPEDDVAALGCQFYKYRDLQGQQRLVWCYGFQPPVKRWDARPVICSNAQCHLLEMRHSESPPKCPKCSQQRAAATAPKRRTALIAGLALLVLLGVGGAAGAGLMLMRPSAELTGKVLRKGDRQPITNAAVKVEGSEVQAQTDASGTFQLKGLRRGAGRVLVSAPGFQDSQAEIEIVSGKDNSVDIVLNGAARLVGQVVFQIDGKDIPVAQANVAAGQAEQPVVTDAEGRFEVTGLVPAAVSLSVKKDGFLESKSDVEAKESADQPLVIRLLGAGQVTGRVVYAADAKTPIADVEIGPQGFEGSSVHSDTNGQFTLTGIPPGEVRLQTSAAGFKQLSQAAKAGDSVELPLEGDATLTGTVQRADTKAAVPDAEIQIPGTPYTAKTNAQGEFKFTGVRSGSVRLNATAPGLTGTLAQDLAAGQSKAVQFLLSGNLTLTGRVINAATKAPVSGAVVSVPDSSLKATTDAQGRYSLAGFTEAPPKVIAAASGFFPEEISIEPAAAKSKLDDIGLKPAASVKGKVFSGKSKQPLAKAEVSYGKAGPKAVTNDQGEFELAPLPSGTAELLVLAAEHAPLKVAPDLKAGAQNLPDLTLTPLASFSGVVLRALDNKPLAGAVVTVAQTGEKATANQQGVFQFSQAPAGEVSISAAAEGYEPLSWKQTLESGSQKIKDVRLEGNTLVKGVVLGPPTKEGKKTAVPKAKLEVAVGTYRKEIVSADNGSFEIGKLPGGNISITARAAGFQVATVSKDVNPKAAWVEIPMVRSIEVAGVVVDAADKKKKVAKATITAGDQKVTTAADGTFKLSGAAGLVAVHVSAPGYAPAVVNTTLDAKTKLEIPLSPLITVQGMVVDAANPRQGIGKVQVRLGSGEVFESATSAANGSFTVKLPAGKTIASATLDGYVDTSVVAALSAASPKIEIRMARGRTISGKVLNAVNNKPVAGALLAVEGAGGKRFTAVSAASGEFKIESVPAGAASVEASAPGFEALSIPAPTEPSAPLRIILSPELAAGEVRLVLTWKDRPRDMDSHLFGKPAGGKPYHVYFDMRAAPGATLDVDAKEGFGPETITMKALPGSYQYYVAHPENLGTADGQGLARSGAQVRVYYKGAKANQPFSLAATRPEALKPLWHVLNIEVDAKGKISVSAANKFSQDLPK